MPIVPRTSERQEGARHGRRREPAGMTDASLLVFLAAAVGLKLPPVWFFQRGGLDAELLVYLAAAVWRPDAACLVFPFLSRAAARILPTNDDRQRSICVPTFRRPHFRRPHFRRNGRRRN